MNALLLEKLTLFRQKNGLRVAQTLIAQKIEYQYAIIKKRKSAVPFLKEVAEMETINALLLVEARAAKEYWKQYGAEVNSHVTWSSRRPHAHDACNQLLDIGYHYLSTYLTKLFLEMDIPTELGLFHKAQSVRAHPLVYDFMEWLRPILIDRTARTFFRKKKKQMEYLAEKDIPRFVATLKKEWGRQYYHKKLGYCITLSYWTKLIVLELEKSIHQNISFAPIFPSLRHETRCKKPRVQARGAES